MLSWTLSSCWYVLGVLDASCSCSQGSPSTVAAGLGVVGVAAEVATCCLGEGVAGTENFSGVTGICGSPSQCRMTVLITKLQCTGLYPDAIAVVRAV